MAQSEPSMLRLDFAIAASRLSSEAKERYRAKFLDRLRAIAQ